MTALFPLPGPITCALDMIPMLPTRRGAVPGVEILAAADHGRRTRRQKDRREQSALAGAADEAPVRPHR